MTLDIALIITNVRFCYLIPSYSLESKWGTATIRVKYSHKTYISKYNCIIYPSNRAHKYLHHFCDITKYKIDTFVT